jgi:hypothetical protein
MGTTRSFEKMGATTQTVVRTSQEPANAVWDHVLRAQDLNTRLTQRTFETWLDAFRRQTELSQDATQELFERTEEQTDALQRLYGQWFGMFLSFPFSGFPYSAGPAYAPRSVQRQGMRLVEAATTNAPDDHRERRQGRRDGNRWERRLPIENYDELTVDEVIQRLGGLSVEELGRMYGYEQRNKNRETLIHEIERNIEAVS